MWIGLNDISNEKEYEWVDESNVNYTNWQIGVPFADDYFDIVCIFKQTGHGEIIFVHVC